ncbi:hypothetical protein Aspvir_009895 [Aspergillus viridinutans]|uniref:Uncharacterized protein n=1 Tax=Aspergillus viridinutans TaxID=75553 RepID=A0A9P3C1C2_ASPVI|nr:uncharacterized protein Aspvir_009895 [Aspergillus viridinutans]GIK05782.1 hypothetical protein Aspvir_009895 [Aspergillus viridinutans]
MKSGFEEEDPTAVFVADGGQDWYKRTVPKFEVSAVFLMVLEASTQQVYVEIDVYEGCEVLGKSLYTIW